MSDTFTETEYAPPEETFDDVSDGLDPFDPDFAEAIETRFAAAEQHLSGMLQPYVDRAEVQHPQFGIDPQRQAETLGQFEAQDVVAAFADNGYEHLRGVDPQATFEVAQQLAPLMFSLVEPTQENAEAVLVIAAEYVKQNETGTKTTMDELKALGRHFGRGKVDLSAAAQAAEDLFPAALEESGDPSKAARTAIRAGFDQINGEHPSTGTQLARYYANRAHLVSERSGPEQPKPKAAPSTGRELAAKFGRRAHDHRIATGTRRAT